MPAAPLQLTYELGCFFGNLRFEFKKKKKGKLILTVVAYVGSGDLR
jgi:hypothetical protein